MGLRYHITEIHTQKKRSNWVYVITKQKYTGKKTKNDPTVYTLSTEIHTQKNDPTGFTVSQQKYTVKKTKNDPTVFTLSHNKNT